jgi:hypothetical protein
VTDKLQVWPEGTVGCLRLSLSDLMSLLDTSRTSVCEPMKMKNVSTVISELGDFIKSEGMNHHLFE